MQANTSYCLWVHLEEPPALCSFIDKCVFFRHDMPLNAFHHGGADHVIIYLCRQWRVFLFAQPLPHISHLKTLTFSLTNAFIFFYKTTYFYCNAILEPRAANNLQPETYIIVSFYEHTIQNVYTGFMSKR